RYTSGITPATGGRSQFDLTRDPNNPTSTFRLAIGEARSQGIEFEVAGAVTDRLSLIGSYAYLDTEITEDGTRVAAGNLSRLGKRLANAQRQAGSLWGTYALSDRFKVGAGVVVVGERQGDFENTYQLPGYARVDAMAAYTWKLGGSRLTAQLNINNLLDKEHFTHTGESRLNGAFPGEPLTVIGALRLEY
ncbi:MAG: TonB-dependent receptor domain-containing protein, partial [Gammaproteobacteria bacterium]